MHDANIDKSMNIGIRKGRQEKHERQIQEGTLRLCLGKQYGLLTPSAAELKSAGGAGEKSLELKCLNI